MQQTSKLTCSLPAYVEGHILTMCVQIVNWLRYGCIPVAVLEGESPPEKQELLQKRCTHYSQKLSGFQLYQQPVAHRFDPVPAS